jgi:hypothetical protein
MSRGRGNFGGERGDGPRRTAAAARWWYWTLREVYDCVGTAGRGRTSSRILLGCSCSAGLEAATAAASVYFLHYQKQKMYISKKKVDVGGLAALQKTVSIKLIDIKGIFSRALTFLKMMKPREVMLLRFVEF